MRGAINDCLRRLIGYSIVQSGPVLELVHRYRIRTFARNQDRLRRRYKIATDTRILSYEPELEKLIQAASARAGHDARFAATSGSTCQPKRILYTKQRLRSLKLTYSDVFARCCWSFAIKHTSLYVFSSLSKDDSLTSMLLDDERLPPYLSTLQAPYRVQAHPVIRALAADYGATAVRLWILAIANPGVLYCTNPSTLSTFLDELTMHWQRSARLIRDWCRKPEAFDGAIHKIARRLRSHGSDGRLERIAKSEIPLHIDLWAPAVEAYICWTGGYVKPFLDRMAKYLPPDRYRLIPMFSMSTETIETVSHFHNGTVAFLPLGSRVLYEFVDVTLGDQTKNLRNAGRLEAGKIYTMVVSDQYGLRRYQTGDLFLCRRMISGLPDLSFVGRRGLEYSFTGEKVTADQVNTVFQRLHDKYPSLSDRFLTCVPSMPADEPLPHYKVILIGEIGKGCGVSVQELARCCDRFLSEMNSEYQSKRTSGRLGHVRVMQVQAGDFIDRITGSRQSNGWESQFKFLPLYRHTWELRKE